MFTFEIFVRTCLSGGHTPIGIHSGVEGLVKGDMQEMKWGDVNGWVSQGGALLGEYFIFFLVPFFHSVEIS